MKQKYFFKTTETFHATVFSVARNMFCCQSFHTTAAKFLFFLECCVILCWFGHTSQHCCIPRSVYLNVVISRGYFPKNGRAIKQNFSLSVCFATSLMLFERCGKRLP